MATRNILVQHSWLREDSLPENVVVNTYSYKWNDAATFGTEEELGDAMETIMDGAYTIIATDISSYMTGERRIKGYDRADAEPRAPIFDRVLTPLAVDGARAPGELAICLSFEAAIISGGNRARRRGRVYLGPVSQSTFTSVTSGVAVATATLERWQDMGQWLLDSGSSANDLEWQVWSSMDNAGHTVTHGWVDDAFDTMRSRGRRPVSRLVFPEPV